MQRKAGFNNRIHLTDSQNSRIRAFSGDGRFFFDWGGQGSNLDEFDIPHDIAADLKNRLHVADTGNIGRYRDDPIELLTLSALGDERAALGLAGVSLKAGAESAMATLWRVDDKATSELIGAFYAQLKMPGTSKAEALQHAQIGMLNSKRFHHPGYWSPFVIIGNWS